MITEFLKYLLTIRGYSANTALAYKRDITDFVRWLHVNDPTARWSTINRDTIDRYISALHADGLAPSTTNRRLASIAAIYRYMIRQGYEVENPCKYESRRKQPVLVPNTIPPEQLKIAYHNAQGVVKVMIGLFATTGIRISELLTLSWEDINFADCSLHIRGKGAKERITYSTPAVLDTLQQVKQTYKPSGLIFKMSQRDTRYMIWQALKPYCTARQLSPHAIRHTFATNMAKQGANVTTIAGLLGHTHISTTQKYIDMSQADLKTACQQYNVLN